MSDLVNLSQGGGLISFLHNAGSFPRPFAHSIYLVSVHIAGTTHVKGIDELETELVAGMRLTFFREPKNPHDTMAIVIKDDKGHKLGYVPRANNEILARLMDAGKLLYGVIQEKEYIDAWLKVTIEVYMDD